MNVNGKDRNVIKGNTIVKARIGISLVDRNGDTSDENKIQDNTILSSKNAGIVVKGKSNVVKGNTIDQSVFSGILVDSLIGSISEGVIIKDNSITNSKGNGIAIAPESLNTVVIENTLAGNNGNLLDFGSNTVKAGNIPPLILM